MAQHVVSTLVLSLVCFDASRVSQAARLVSNAACEPGARILAGCFGKQTMNQRQGTLLDTTCARLWLLEWLLGRLFHEQQEF